MRTITIFIVFLFLSSCVENIIHSNREVEYSASIPLLIVTKSDISKLAKKHWYFIEDEKIREQSATCQAYKMLRKSITNYCVLPYKTYQESCIGNKNKIKYACVALINISLNIINNKKMATAANIEFSRRYSVEKNLLSTKLGKWNWLYVNSSSGLFFSKRIESLVPTTRIGIGYRETTFYY